MMSNMLMIGLAACCLYVLFHLWYGGRGKPMTADEVEHYMRILDSLAADKESRQLLGSLRALALADDGEGFVMQNLVRYRSRRDFLRFAVSIARKGIDMHKWAAIEKTHVFLVKPLLSLIFVRGLVAVLLALVVLAVALL